jgi:hypothetical protein
VLGAIEDPTELEFDELPSLEHAQEVLANWRHLLAERVAEGAPDWEVRVAQKYEHWATALVAAVEDGHPTCELRVQVLRIGHVALVALNVEAFFQTGLQIRAESPFAETFVLGFSNGIVSDLPLAEDHPPGGWSVDESYAVPDLIPQASALPVILHPDSERHAVAFALDVLARANAL